MARKTPGARGKEFKCRLCGHVEQKLAQLRGHHAKEHPAAGPTKTQKKAGRGKIGQEEEPVKSKAPPVSASESVKPASCKHHHLQRVEVAYWECSDCGAQHDIQPNPRTAKRAADERQGA